MRNIFLPTGLQRSLTSFADEICVTAARLVVYVGMLALLFIGGIHVWEQLHRGDDAAPAKPGWNAAKRSYPAFAVSQPDKSEKTEAYEIFRHPEGGRKDVFHWTALDEKPLAELEIYRPGGELGQFQPDDTGIASRIDPTGLREPQAAGVIATKFGPVTLLRLGSDSNGPHACLGFVKRFDDPALRISGWSCQGGSIAARQSAIGCTLNRLTLLTSGNDPKLAELFAGAELKRSSCSPSAGSPATSDWIMGAESPVLRGHF